MSAADDQADGHFSEFLQFLTPETRPELRNTALHYLEGLSPGADGLHLFCEKDYQLTTLLLNLCQSVPFTFNCTIRCFINFTANSHEFCNYLASNDTAMSLILSTEHKNSELVAKLLSNITIHSEACEKVWSQICQNSPEFVQNSLDQINLNVGEPNAVADYNGYVLRNLSQLKLFRLNFVKNSSKSIFSLLPLIKQSINVKRKLLAVDILRNCCFDDDIHKTLVESVEVVVSLLMPLIGGEDLTDDENDCLPMDLQYMQSDKTRESDVDVRTRLLETLYQLCSTSCGREYLRNNGAYYILREYHKWEKNEECDRLCENLIGVLIRTEDEIGTDNIRQFDDEQK